MLSLKRLFRIAILPFVLVILTVSAASAQLELPDAPRGAHSRAPFALTDDDSLSATRGGAVWVSTTVDENSSCSLATGLGISLREALTFCLAGAPSGGIIIYLPAGTYTLSSLLVAEAGVSFMLVGEDPLTTVITTGGTWGALQWTHQANIHVRIANVTISGAGDSTSGGAIRAQYGAGTGIASLSLENVIFTGNNGEDGGAVRINNVGSAPLNINISSATFTDNTATNNGGGLAITTESDAKGAVSITGSVFTGNEAGVDTTCTRGGGGLAVLGVDSLLTVAIADTTISENTTSCGGSAFLGGAVIMSQAALTVLDVDVLNNTAPSGAGFSVFDVRTVLIDGMNAEGNQAPGSGGGLMIFNSSADGEATVVNSTFTGNSTQSVGGGLHINNVRNVTLRDITVTTNFSGLYAGGLALIEIDSLWMSGLLVDGNGAAGLGAGLYVTINNEGSMSLTDSTIINNVSASSAGGLFLDLVDAQGWIANTVIRDNIAVANGGGLLVDASVAVPSQLNIVDSQISNNTANRGGGLFVNPSSFDVDSGAINLLNTVIEDNIALDVFDRSPALGSDCYNRNSELQVVSLGNVGMTNISGCDFTPHPTDQVDNLLLNGGFEFGTSTPDDWTVSDAVGDKRQCNTETKTVAEYGNCSYKFTVTEGELTVIKQNVDLDVHNFSDGKELLLYAMGDGSASSKVNVQVTVTYNNPDLDKTKLKLTFEGKNDFFEPVPGAPGSLILTEGDLKKLQVKVSNKSTAGTFYLDRVYLFLASSLTGAVTRTDAALPLPVVPDGFRN